MDMLAAYGWLVMFPVWLIGHALIEKFQAAPAPDKT